MDEIETFAFAGPSLWRQEPAPLANRKIRILPPCRPGDLTALADAYDKPRTVALIDLDFHHPPVLTHGEILAVIRTGWQVWGLAGLGAVRGVELRDLGMRGFGKISKRMQKSGTLCDDEVICLHRAEAPYTAASEPLIHLRQALSWLVAENRLGRGEARKISNELERKWFGDRTIETFNALLMEQKVDGKAVTEMARCFDSFRIQRKDVDRFFAGCPYTKEQ